MRKNRRRGKGSAAKLLRSALRAVAATIAIAATSLLAARLVVWARAHPYFTVREIEVDSRGTLDATTIVSWAKLAPGMSVWHVNAERVARDLSSHPRVLAATVERRLPNQVFIRVAERSPVAILLASEPMLIADDGVAFAPSAGEALGNLPYVSGLGGKDPASPAVAERLRGAARLAVLWREHGEWPAISEIRPDGDDLLVFASGTPMAVRFAGGAGDEEFARLSAVLELWRGRESQVAAIDVSLPGEAVLKLRRRKPARAANRTTI